ncbi:hypothetical protein XELAEV_18038175mg [Xenopus laevis]|uniref:LIM zinc-binding domain-containing protein n=1 Tax=Xenopus laevis TaxID=8355 RepID=A0A974C5J6_XENLA|nr:hypothetical protein XELAEV_18038175mg [Xenopus laevis]
MPRVNHALEQEPDKVGCLGDYCGCSNAGSVMVNNRSSESTTTAVSSNGSPPKACAGCGGKIGDRFLLYSMDRYWHTRCLKCSCCQAQLGEIGTSCYTKSGMILCRNDYIR